MSAAYQDHFLFAYSCAVAAGIYAIGCWLYSDMLAQKRGENTYLIYVPNDTRSKTVLKFRFWQLLPCFLLSAICGLVCWAIHHLSVQEELLSLNGVLIPANDPLPKPFPCPLVPNGKSLVVLVGNVTLLSSIDQLRVVAFDEKLPNNDNTLLSIDRGADGKVTVNVYALDDEGNVILEIDQNRFLINRNKILDSLSPPRPDKSTISIKDQKGGDLRIRLMDRNTLSFKGRLYFVGKNYVDFREGGIFVGPPDHLIVGNLCVNLNRTTGGLIYMRRAQ